MAAAVCIAFALAIYQAYLPLTAALFVLLLIQKLLLCECGWYNGFRRGLRYLAVLLSGYIIYYAVLQWVLRSKKLTLNSYRGINEMGRLSLKQLPSLLLQTYQNSLRLVQENYCSLSSTPLLQKCILILAVCCVVFGFAGAIGKKRGWIERILIALLTAALPVAANAIVIMCPNTKEYTLMLYGMLALFLAPVLLAQMWRMGRLVLPALLGKLVHGLTLVCTALVILNYVWTANGSYMYSYYATRQTVNYLGRLVVRMESADGYTDEAKIAFLGKEISDRHLKNPWAKSDFDFGGLRPTMINSYSRDKYLKNYFGFSYTKASKEEKKALRQLSQVQEMPCYPDDGSIKMVDGFLVVKLEEIGGQGG